MAAWGPAVLERLGLRRRSGGWRSDFARCTRASCGCGFGPCERASRQQEEAVYRVAQESLQNCAKHSRATRINLSLRFADKGIRLRVADNGAGFSTDRARNKPMAFGLAGMRERAALMGGTLAVRSAPGKGAEIVLDLPPILAPVRDHVKNTSIAD